VAGIFDDKSLCFGEARYIPGERLRDAVQFAVWVTAMLLIIPPRNGPRYGAKPFNPWPYGLEMYCGEVAEPSVPRGIVL
jgi:hypothetical protein